MKTRTGFVSNSSSSSFIVVGVQKEQDAAWKFLFEEKAEALYNEISKHDDFVQEVMQWDGVEAEEFSIQAIMEDEMVQEAIRNLEQEWELLYCVSLDDGMGVHNGGEYDDSLYFGWYMGSPYSCTEDVTTMITDAAAKYEAVKDTIDGVKIYSVYSGY